MNRFDASLFRAVNRLADRTSWAHGATVAYAKFGIVTFAALLVLGWWAARGADVDMMARVLWAGAGAVVAIGLNQLIGGMVDRARPYETLPGVHVLIPRTTDFSFPSDHAVVVGAVATGLLLAHRGLGSLAVVLALMMAAARVYVGAHYPGDVIAGLGLGAIVHVAGGVVAVPVLHRVLAGVEKSPLRPLVRRADDSKRPLAAGHRS